MSESVLSVGIDIGTSTSSLVLSRIYLENTASCFSIPRVTIVDKEIIYRSQIYATPLKGEFLIDMDEMKKIIETEYRLAGVRPEEIDTGAVIITGESAKKENAARVTDSLSEFAGDFVVATAGPDLESVIAGKGAGAQQYSEEYGCTVVNLDIGGGTTNIAVFQYGELIGQGCLDVGGRLVRFGGKMAGGAKSDAADPEMNGEVAHVSPRVKALCEELGISIQEGRAVCPEAIRALTKGMATALEQALKEPTLDRGLYRLLQTPMSSELCVDLDLREGKGTGAICFSGGIADCIYEPRTNLYEYGDIGIFLAESIRESGLCRGKTVIRPKETIRATVVGAGTYTTTISGSTITYTKEIFPLKSIPAFVIEKKTEENALRGDGKELTERAAWFLSQSKTDNLIFCFRGIQNPSYRQICELGRVLAEVSAQVFAEEQPLLILVERDMGKALGQSISRALEQIAPGRKLPAKDVVCIDSVKVQQGDYLDIGKPLMGGMVLPVVVKTLIFQGTKGASQE